MPFPTTQEELVRAGYVKRNDAKCSSLKCSALVTWWKTPNNKHLAINRDTAIAHFLTCLDAKRFRKKKRKHVKPNQVS